MALVNALSSLSLASAPRTSGVGFKKSVASFVVSPPKVSGSASARGVLQISCKQNKKARALQRCDAARDAVRAFARSHAMAFRFHRVRETSTTSSPRRLARRATRDVAFAVAARGRIK